MSINQMSFISAYPGAIYFARPSARQLVSGRRVRGAKWWFTGVHCRRRQTGMSWSGTGMPRRTPRIVQLTAGRSRRVVPQNGRNASKDAADRAAHGRPFQTCGAAERKARDAILVFVLGSTNKSLPADRKTVKVCNRWWAQRGTLVDGVVEP